MTTPSHDYSTLFTVEDIAALESIRRESANPDRKIRAKGLLLLAQCNHPKEVAFTMLVSVNTISRWLKQWKKHGINSIMRQYGKNQTDNPPYSDLAFKHFLKDTLDQSPTDVGLDVSHWQIPPLMSYVLNATRREMTQAKFVEWINKIGWGVNPIRKLERWEHNPQTREDARKILDQLAQQNDWFNEMMVQVLAEIDAEQEDNSSSN